MTAEDNSPQSTVAAKNREITAYWNDHIHDLSIAKSPIGTPGFFQELDVYRFDKLRYLPRVVDFDGYDGQSVLEIGCGAGIDLAHFAHGGAITTGIDLASVSIDLAEANFQQRGLYGTFYVMDGADMRFEDNSFDLVYAHGVLQYAADPAGIVAEMLRVLKPGGEAIIMVYNRHSWLPVVSRLTRVELEHTDAPAYRLYSRKELEQLTAPFAEVRIISERFPVATKLHAGWKATLYNDILVRLFDALPKSMIQRFGWHLLAFARKKP